MKKNTMLGFMTLLFILVNQVVQAQTFNVSTTQGFRLALQNAAGNSQADIIILADGTYSTTDDKGGTFMFLDNENYSLTIRGSSAENVILSGNNTNQVLNINIVNSTVTVYLDRLLVVNGVSSGDGGGVFSNTGINIQKCTISGNTSSGYGGGFCSRGDATVMDSTISDNTASFGGGGFLTFKSAIITKSNILRNIGGNWGGGIYGGKETISSTTTIKDSTISDNTASYGGGLYAGSYQTVTINSSHISRNNTNRGGAAFWAAGCYSSSWVKITNSTISGNASLPNGYYGAGPAGYSNGGAVTITNSIISNNTASCTIYSRNQDIGGDGIVTIINSLIADNDTLKGLCLGAPSNKIVNTVFFNNGNFDVSGDATTTATFDNNYIDESKIDIQSFNNNNIFNGNLGFTDQANHNFHIGASSVLIDAGGGQYRWYHLSVNRHRWKLTYCWLIDRYWAL